MSEIVLDRKTFSALAEKTRIQILKSLRKHQKTQSELAKELGLAVSTVAEHLGKLCEAGLVRPKKDKHKWVYFHLTQKGGYIVSPEKHTGIFVFALSISLLMIVGSLFMMFSYAPAAGMGRQEMPQAAPTIAKAGQLNETGFTTAIIQPDYVPLVVLCTGILLLVISIVLWMRIRHKQSLSQ